MAGIRFERLPDWDEKTNKRVPSDKNAFVLNLYYGAGNAATLDYQKILELIDFLKENEIENKVAEQMAILLTKRNAKKTETVKK